MPSIAHRKPRLIGAHINEQFRNQQLACRAYAFQHGIDSPEITVGNGRERDELGSISPALAENNRQSP
jgi:hypothetical protein